MSVRFFWIKSVFSVLLAIAAFSAGASSLDDVGFLFRAGYNPVELKNELSWNIYEFYNALTVGAAATGNSTVSIVGGRRSSSVPDPAYSTTVGNKVRQETVDVAMPYARRTLKSRQVIHFLQPSYVKDDVTYYATSALQAENSSSVKGIPTFDNDSDSGYSAVLRFKFDGFVVEGETYCKMLGLGYGYSAETGLDIDLMGDPDNLYLRLYRGSKSVEVKGMQNAPSTRLMRGKWIDMAVTVCKGNVSIWTCVEGQALWSWSDTVARPSSPGTPVARIWMPNQSKANTNGGVKGAEGVANMFRGSLQQLAVWSRALTKDEVLDAFMDGCSDGEILRFGVNNDSAEEFAGYNKITKKTTSSTSADLATDWRYLPPALTSTGRVATVTFTPNARDLTLQPLELTLKTTTASEEGAVTIALNGTALTAAKTISPGATVVVDVPSGLLKTSENTLVFTRTDDGTGDLACDFFTLSAKEVVPVTKTSDEDVFADAYAWYRRASDLDGNGRLRVDASWSQNGTSYEFPEAFHDRPERRFDNANKWTVAGPETNALHQSVSVTCPARGVTLENERVVYLIQPSWPTNDAQTLWIGHCGYISHPIFAITNAGDFAAFTRIKIDPNLPNGAPSASHSVELFGLGYDYSSSRGLKFQLMGSDTGNFYINLWRGKEGTDLKATQSGDEKNRLCVGKWIDIGVSNSNGVLRVYTQVEGGTMVEQTVPNRITTVSAAASSTLFLGTSSGMYCCSPWKSSPLSGAEKKALNAFRGWIHQAAVWSRRLTAEEMAKAFAWPSPDVFRLGAANGTASEFAGEGTSFTVPENADFSAAPGVVSVQAPLSITFDITAQEASSNQFIRLTLPPDERAFPYEFEFAINGQTVTNWASRTVSSSRFTADSDGVVEVGVRHGKLVEGENVLTVKRTDGRSDDCPFDSLTLGNGGHPRFVRGEPTGMILILR